MKKLLTVAALLVAAYATQAQGTVNFNNRVSGVVDAPVFDVGGTTKLDGAGFSAGLYEGDTLVGAAVPFRTGAGAGYWNPVGGADRTTSVAAGANATLTVRAWEASGGATYAAAVAAGKKAGKSDAFTVATGGAGAPPSLPSNLAGLKSFQLLSRPGMSFWSHAVARGQSPSGELLGDVRIYAEDGAPVALASGLRFRRIASEAKREPFYDVQWRPKTHLDQGLILDTSAKALGEFVHQLVWVFLTATPLPGFDS